MRDIAELREEAMFTLWNKGWTEEEIEAVLKLTPKEQQVRRQMGGVSRIR